MSGRIIHDLPAEEYHTPTLGRCSKSALDQIHRSPAHYREWLDTPNEDTPAFSFGRAFHCAILEPSLFRERYAVRPKLDLRTKAGKAARDEWQANNLGRIPLSDDWANTITAMHLAVLRHPLAAKLLTGGTPEVSVRWTDADTGLDCQCRADYYLPQLGVLVDLKSTTDASADAFRRSVASYRYHVQDAHYRAGFAVAGVNIDRFIFVAVEKSAPYGVAVYTLDADAQGRGYSAMRRDIDTMHKCVTNDSWPSYPAKIQELNLPPWAD